MTRSTGDLTDCWSSQRVAAPEKESVSCLSYPSSSSSFSSYGACDREEVRRCLAESCGQEYRPVWAGERLEEVAREGEQCERVEECGHLLLGEESECLPPCTTTNLDTVFMYKTESRKTVRYHTLTLPNRFYAEEYFKDRVHKICFSFQKSRPNH